MPHAAEEPLTVYAIVGARDTVRLWRIAGGERLRVVRGGRCAAVVSNAPRRSPSPEHLRRHDRTVRAIAERCSAVIPVRFGTIMTEEELVFTLSSRGATLGEALARVRNRAQMTIRVTGQPVRAAGGSAGVARSGSRNLRRGSGSASPTGREYLLARASDAASNREIRGFEPIRHAVARWVRDERVEHHAGVTSVYHLIPRSSVAAYREAVQASAPAAGLRAIVSGPWPPYAFASPD